MQRYQVVTQNDIDQIHETSLKILDEIGVVFDYLPAIDILVKGGAKSDGKVVRFPRKMVEQALSTTPSSFTLHARTEKKNVAVNCEASIYAGPNCPPFVVDAERGRRNGSLEDFNNFAKLHHVLDNLDVQSQIYCEAQDIPEDIRHLEMLYSSIRYNEKPIMGGTLGYEQSKDCIELAAIAHGGVEEIKKNPIMTSIPCTLTPLSYDDKMAGAIIAYAEYGQPQLINSLVMAGSTTPVTIAGAIAVQNAEVLAGIVLAQLVNPGTPIVYSAAGTNTDMSTGSLSIGSPEDALFSLINGQLCKHYQIPCRISGAITDSKTPDAQAGYESMMNLMTAEMAGGNYILHAVGILESFNAVSYEKYVIDHEMIGMIKRINQGVTVDEETLAYDIIKEVGPRGAFIDQDHTAEHFREEIYMPSAITDRANHVNWVANGELDTQQRATAMWKRLLEEYVEPTLPSDVEKDMRKFIEARS